MSGAGAALGVARLDDEELLQRAGVDLDALADGKLEQRSRQ
jgi:hypothetical protein